MNRELLYYKRVHYPYLKQDYESQGCELYSLSQLSQSTKIEELIENGIGRLVIDLSSSMSILTDTRALFDIERIIDLFPEDTIFISDIANKEKKYELRFCFSEFNEYATTVPIEESREEDSVNPLKVTKVTSIEGESLRRVFNDFNSLLYGHEQFKEDLMNLITTFKVFNSIGEHKILSLFLMGNSGVGKTEVARAMYKAIGGRNRIVKINFGNYSSDNALNSLIGSPRGFIGSETGELFDKILGTDVGVILIDEFEKANTPVFNFFLEVLESGVATNSLGEEVDLSGYIIIFTSNIGRDNFTEYFSPELRSRFDYIGYFGYLSRGIKDQYVNDRIENIIKKYNRKYGTKFNNKTKENIIRNINIETTNNLRELNRVIRIEFTDYLKKAKKI